MSEVALRFKSLFIILFCSCLVLCKEVPNEVEFPKWKIEEKLSAYPFFDRIKSGNNFDIQELAGASSHFLNVSYDLNSPLFSDFMEKERIIFLPKGSQMNYDSEKTFSFPEGSVISKTFRVTEEIRSSRYPTGKRIETRLLIKRGGEWFAVSYLWQEDEKDAKIAYGGAIVRLGTDKNEFDYGVPSRNQCAQCHQVYENEKQTIVPIGPKAKHLNRKIASQNGDQEQLEAWKEAKILVNLPRFGRPKLPNYKDESHTNEERARAYLDINCAHCHQAVASGGINSKLLLNYENSDLTSLGICKQPGSAGKGGGENLKFDIVPGKPEASILVYRMETRNPGAMMPQIGRALTDPLGVGLVKAWIQDLPGQDCR